MMGKFGIYNTFSEWKKGDLPGDPSVNIVLNECFRKDKCVFISANLASDSEIDYAIDALIKDIESVRKKAKKVLRKQKEKIRASFTEKTSNS